MILTFICIYIYIKGPQHLVFRISATSIITHARHELSSSTGYKIVYKCRLRYLFDFCRAVYIQDACQSKNVDNIILKCYLYPKTKRKYIS